MQNKVFLAPIPFMFPHPWTFAGHSGAMRLFGSLVIRVVVVVCVCVCVCVHACVF